MATSFQRAYPPSRATSGPAFWLAFRGNELLVQERDASLALLRLEEADIVPLEPSGVLFLGTLGDTPCLACEVSAEQTVPAGWRSVGIRMLFDHLDEATYSVVGYAAHILRWQKDSRFCPVCGHLLGEFSEQWMRQCTNCDYIGYPPVTPAVLVLVHDGPRVLLAHKPGWGSRYSIIAGFVEPGESLEQCVQREVMEEVGVSISDITYVSSQPWPFPHQLMVGFMARYVSGEICPDQKEIDEAAWFRFDQLPDLPPPLSLSRQLIIKWANAQDLPVLGT
jgi:NAD+ diphosphatase